MATISYHICDRCKGEINPHSAKTALVPLYRHTKILWVITGITIEDHKELCGNCALKLEEFLDNE